jgi:hypothetical protein
MKSGNCRWISPIEVSSKQVLMRHYSVPDLEVSIEENGAWTGYTKIFGGLHSSQEEALYAQEVQDS